MKSVNISVVLFFYLYDYFIYGDESKHDEITVRLKEKMNRMQLRKLYSDSKTAETESERETARKEYLYRVGVREDFRY
ncbi:MAG: complexin-2 [Mogibacterium sp.]|nr:complexin-2 [Mogibacterium sp.]